MLDDLFNKFWDLIKHIINNKYLESFTINVMGVPFHQMNESYLFKITSLLHICLFCSLNFKMHIYNL